MKLSLSLAQEYLRLYRDASIHESFVEQINTTLYFIARLKNRIQSVNTNTPWHVSAIILTHDSNVLGLSWDWEPALEGIIKESLIGGWDDWSLAGTLYALEGFYTNWIYQLRGRLAPDIWGGTNYPLSGSFINGRWSETLAPKRILGVAPVLKSIYRSSQFPDLQEPDSDVLLLGQGSAATIKVIRLSFLVGDKNLTPQEQRTRHSVGTGNGFNVTEWRLETNKSNELFMYFVLSKPVSGFYRWYVRYSDISFV